MKHYTVLILFLLGGLVAGCYTQLGTVREDRTIEEEYTYRQSADDVDTTVTTTTRRYNHYDEYETWDRPYPRFRAHMSYYYPSTFWPSVGFNIAYRDPYWGWGSCFGGTVMYYDPWYCGTPVVFYPWPVYYPIYYPYYADPYPYYGSGDGKVVRRNRDFGSTRGSVTRTSGSTRDDRFRNDTELPRAGSIGGRGDAGRGGAAAPATAPENIRGRRGGVSRTDTPPAPGGEPSSQNPRRGRREEVRPPQSGAEQAPPSPPPGARDERGRKDENRGGREGGSRRDYNPPPAPSSPPPSYNPPPSRGNAPSGGNQQGGTRDSGRRR